MKTFHEPVLRNEVVDGLLVVPGKKYIDTTAGGGGHSEEILQRGGVVLAIDRDADAISELVQKFSDNKHIRIVKGNFRDLATIATKEGFSPVDGIVFDLGISSYQLNTRSRGFSTKFSDAPLDLRMSQDNERNAEDVFNTESEEKLYEIISTFGEEELAGPISHALVSARKVARMHTVGDILSVIESALPQSCNPARVFARVFQAIRIYINDEVQALKEGLAASGAILRHGGRLAVVSFHSLEDRIVKRCLTMHQWKIITKKPIRPSRLELSHNYRAHSAKLRLASRV